MIIRVMDKHPLELTDGIWRTVLCHTNRLMQVELLMRKGSSLDAHQHHHDQISYVVRGILNLVVDGQPIVLSAGESCLVRPNQVHSAEALTDLTVIDTFAPPREDFLQA